MDWISYLAEIRMIAGIAVPIVVIAVIAFIALVFVVALIFFFIQSGMIFDNIRRAMEILKGKTTPIESSSLEELREKFASIPKLADLWEEFNESLITDKSVGGTKVAFNTERSEHFFSPENVIEHYLDRSLYSSVPGILTSLGLLGTFIALFFAMHTLHVQGSGQVQGIEGFINNLSGKFLSSIFGLGLALVFLFVEKVVTGELHRKCLTLQKRIDRLFTMHLQENVLLKMLRQIEDQSSAFKLFSADLSGCLQASFKESMGVPMERLISAVEKLELATDEMKKQKEESSSQALGEMIEQFQNSLTTSANTEIAKLGSVLLETSEFARGMNERMGSYLGQVDKMIVAQQAQNDTQNKALTDAVFNLVSKLETSSSSQLSAIEDSVARLIDQSTKWSGQLHSQMETGTAKQSQAMEELLIRMRSSAQEHWIQTNARLAEVVETVTSSSNGVVSNLERLTERVSNDEAHIQKLLGSVNSSIESFQAVVTNNRAVIGELTSIVGTIEKTSSQLIQSSTVLADSTKDTRIVLSQLSDGISMQNSSFAEIKGTWSKQAELYDVMDQKLGNAVRTVNEALVEYSNATSEGLSKHLEEFDTSLAEACRRLGSTVNELDEQLGELTEVIDTSLSKLPTRS